MAVEKIIVEQNGHVEDEELIIKAVGNLLGFKGADHNRLILCEKVKHPSPSSVYLWAE